MEHAISYFITETPPSVVPFSSHKSEDLGVENWPVCSIRQKIKHEFGQILANSHKFVVISGLKLVISYIVKWSWAIIWTT